jgi:NitT/TauT family transport system substrate-binding protein
MPNRTQNGFRKTFGLVLMVVFVGSALLSACAPKPKTEDVTLRLALIPVLDTLPLYVAEQEGFFEAHNVNVTFIAVGSGPERDQLIAASQADGMINEILSTQFSNREKTTLQIVRFARAATADSPIFRILAAKDSGIQSVNDLKGVQIGVSDGTVIAYLTERLLEEEGFTTEEIQTISVPKIPDRLSLLDSGELKAAMMPEPFSSLSVQNGARVILDDSSHPELSCSTITFRKEIIDQYPETIKAFLAAVEDAVNAINQNPEKYSSLMTEKQLIPALLTGTFAVPQFVNAGVPTEAQFADALDWAKRKGLINVDVSYAESVNDAFLP